MVRVLLSVLAFLLACAAPAAAQPVRTEHVETELHAARAAVAPGETFTLVLRQSIIPGWHTYWSNPGDSGEPTEITWSLPPGVSAGEMQWPIPAPIPFAMLVNYGYSDEVLFPVEIAVPASAQPGQSLTLTADVYWLVCADICIPEEGVLTLSVPVAAQGADDPIWAPRIAEAVAALPQPASLEARISAGEPAQLTLAMPEPGARAPYFFPFSRDAIDHAAAQAPGMGEAGFSLSLAPGAGGALGGAPLEGVLRYETAAGEVKAVVLAAQPGPPLPGTSGADASGAPQAALEAAPVTALALLGALAFAFLGGLILNIMPCVLPVLSIKALSLAGGAHTGEARRHGLLYLGGVLVTFLALAALLIGLRAGGAALGWGFQLQVPWITGALALLFFAIGLNLIGVFEVRGAENLGASLAGKGGDAGAFFTGALAVVAATPCTAPFMAGAMGVALTQSWPVTLAVFGALALGFAAPIAALSFAPALQKLIPRPGPWMEKFKQVLAFPMFGAAVWLAWVLTTQAGAAGALALLSLAAALAFALFVARWGRAWLAAGLVVLALTGAFAWRPLIGQEEPAALASQPWSAGEVAALQAEGRGVFVNFTASWCVSCQVNEAVALSRPAVAQAFADENIAYLKGDWTNRDEAIAAELARHGRAGVPLYLFYAPGAGGGAPIILPQLLTEDLVLDAIRGGQQ